MHNFLLGADDTIAVISPSNQGSVWASVDWQQERCHVVYSTGITACNLSVMKTQLEEKKRERSWSWNNKYRMQEKGWEKIDYGPHGISSLALWRIAKNLTCEAEAKAVKWVFTVNGLLYVHYVSVCAGLHALFCKYIWVCVTVSGAHKHSTPQNKQRMWLWIVLKVSICRGVFILCDRRRMHWLPHVTTETKTHTDLGSWEAKGIKVNFV